MKAPLWGFLYKYNIIFIQMSYNENIDEAVEQKGSLVPSNLLKDYIDNFYKRLSNTEIGYRKGNLEEYSLENCGWIYCKAIKDKVVTKYIHFNMDRKILLKSGKVYYTFVLDQDTYNFAVKYNEYNHKESYPIYAKSVEVKKFLKDELVKAGFSVKSDVYTIYVSSPDYIAHPEKQEDEKLGLVLLTQEQKGILENLKRDISYSAVKSFGDNGLTLFDVTIKSNKLPELLIGQQFQKMKIKDNGNALCYFFKDDKEPAMKINNVFTKTSKKENQIPECVQKILDYIEFDNVVKEDDKIILENVFVKKDFYLDMMGEPLEKGSLIDSIEFHKNGWVSVCEDEFSKYTLTQEQLNEDFWMPNFYNTTADGNYGVSTYASMAPRPVIYAHEEPFKLGNKNAVIMDGISSITSILSMLRGMTINELQYLKGTLSHNSEEERILLYMIDTLQFSTVQSEEPML